MKSPLRLWFGVSARVNPLEYALSGIILMFVKYSIEAIFTWRYTGFIMTLWNFMNPLLSVRTEILRPAPEWVGWAIVVWTLPFLWIAISMSVRRVADAGGSPWCGLVVLVPVVNLFFMLAMCLIPSRSGTHWMPRRTPSSGERHFSDNLLGIGGSLVVGAAMVLVSIFWFKTYGASLFLGTPVLMGATSSYIANRKYSRSYLKSISIGMMGIFIACLALLLLALEGFICIFMAVPLLFPLGALGGIIGKAIAESTRRSDRDLLMAIAAFPLLAGLEWMTSRTPEYEVMTAVEIDASPEVIWQHIVDFPDLQEPEQWYFRYGIACPKRARIRGKGVGATRYCEFTTGTFVEPITVWDAPHRLGFDVTDQPAPMFELSPYRHIHPPHLHGYLRSNHGEFLLKPLSNGRTRLEGHTWYVFQMYPQWYWTLWSDMLIHRIHSRVLMHVKHLSEQPDQFESMISQTHESL